MAIAAAECRLTLNSLRRKRCAKGRKRGTKNLHTRTFIYIFFSSLSSSVQLWAHFMGTVDRLIICLRCPFKKALFFFLFFHFFHSFRSNWMRTAYMFKSLYSFVVKFSMLRATITCAHFMSVWSPSNALHLRDLFHTFQRLCGLWNKWLYDTKHHKHRRIKLFASHWRRSAVVADRMVKAESDTQHSDLRLLLRESHASSEILTHRSQCRFITHKTSSRRPTVKTNTRRKTHPIFIWYEFILYEPNMQ